MKQLELDVRYYHLERRGAINEDEFRHRTLRWRLPSSQVALVLVDVWSDHYTKSHLHRGHRITLERILPVLEAFRALGAAVVHAPSPDCARKYPGWTAYAGDREIFGEPGRGAASEDWPPADFRARRGDYAAYARPQDPPDQVFDDIIKNRSIIPEVAPRGDDMVVVTGDQLHRLLRHRKILQLFYAGFAANMCVPFRDYGMRAMKARGYEVILIRDCTTAIEVADTVGDLLLSRAAVVDVEQNTGYSVSSSDLIAACRAAG